ncbi:hypothetical protein ONZ45_g19489 [Pleurotus djamor]|nr:hypothetical protein ONZ45_g19489 [Pleurotus djamor]
MDIPALFVELSQIIRPSLSLRHNPRSTLQLPSPPSVDVHEVFRRKVSQGEEAGRSVAEEEMLYGYHDKSARRRRVLVLGRGRVLSEARIGSLLKANDKSGSPSTSVASGASGVPGFKRPVTESPPLFNKLRLILSYSPGMVL